MQKMFSKMNEPRRYKTGLRYATLLRKEIL